MHIGVIHIISDRQGWDAVTLGLDPATLPEGYELLATGTAAGVDRALCLWDAPSVADLQRLLDGMLGTAARNDVFALAQERSYVAPPAGVDVPAQAAPSASRVDA